VIPVMSATFGFFMAARIVACGLGLLPLACKFARGSRDEDCIVRFSSGEQAWRDWTL
jgi:hypothetical protein